MTVESYGVDHECSHEQEGKASQIHACMMRNSISFGHVHVRTYIANC